MTETQFKHFLAAERVLDLRLREIEERSKEVPSEMVDSWGDYLSLVFKYRINYKNARGLRV